MIRHPWKTKFRGKLKQPEPNDMELQNLHLVAMLILLGDC